MHQNAKVRNNKEDESFNNLLTEITLYLDSNDKESLQYLLDGQSSDKLMKIRHNITPNHLPAFDEVVASIKSQEQQDSSYNEPFQERKVKPILQKAESQSNSDYENIEKQFKVTDIIYGENYSYPFLNLLQKMSLIYFYKSNLNPFPQNCLKMLHSLIQTLFTFVFDPKIKENYQLKSHKHKKSFNNFFKEYLFYVFQKEYQKFTTFHKLFKTIKTSLSKKSQITEEDVNLEKSKSLHHPLITTQNLEELQYFESISAQIKSDTEFKEFTKIKSLNFMYFGQRRLKDLIDPSGKFLAENMQKEIMQLISFVLCRFVRKVILGCIRKKMKGKLCGLLQNEQIQSVEVKIIGNEIIDKYHKKVEQYLKLDEPIQEAAKRTFIREFYEYEYETFIPRNIIQSAQNVILKDQNSFLSLPQTVWNLNRQYQTLWTQRLGAEEYIREQQNEHSLKRERAKSNNYTGFIIQHMKQFQENPSVLWIKYLTMVNQVPPQLSQSHSQSLEQGKNKQKESGLKTRKKIKLQSLDS